MSRFAVALALVVAWSPSARADLDPEVDKPYRLLVAREAALLINQDFGLVGTVTQVGKDGEVTVRLKGGALGVPLQPWAGKGQVFAIAAIGRPGSGRPSEHLEWALLRVEKEPD